MALFVKRQHSLSDVPTYSIGLSKTVLIVGLGNIGKDYDLTRHNIGFDCLDYFAEQNDFPAWTTKKDLKATISIHNLGETRVVLCKPTTYMNNSGQAIRAVQDFYKIDPSNTVIVHDEIDIPFGQIRSRQGGGSAGHNGIKSAIEHGSENSGRVRIGIRNDIAEKADSADFVLGKFAKDEQTRLPAITKEVNSILTEYIFGGTLATDTRTLA